MPTAVHRHRKNPTRSIGALAFALASWGWGAACARADEVACLPNDSAYQANGSPISLRGAISDHMLKILAIGSSSTEGIGASSPDHVYPARLAAELNNAEEFATRVRNAGVGGEVASGTLVRLKAALASGWPELVIWQVGTNDALVGVDKAGFRATVENGVVAARAAGVPLILVDPQFSPRLAAPPAYEDFVRIIDDVAERDHVPLFSRYAMMKTWALGNAAGVAPLLSKDGLHMNDAGYACLAHGLARSIEQALKDAPGAGSKL